MTKTPITSTILTATSPQPIIANRVFATFLFLFVETMFFSALFSAYFVIKKDRVWELPGPVHLQRVAAGFNTAVLLASALSFFFAMRPYTSHRDTQSLRAGLIRTLGLGVLFAGFQMVLGSKLMAAGLTMTSSIFGSCYFLLVGAHSLHALVGLALMGSLYLKSKKVTEISSIQSLFWYWLFVAGVWPIIYAEIYF